MLARLLGKSMLFGQEELLAMLTMRMGGYTFPPRQLAGSVLAIA